MRSHLRPSPSTGFLHGHVKSWFLAVTYRLHLSSWSLVSILGSHAAHRCLWRPCLSPWWFYSVPTNFKGLHRRAETLAPAWYPICCALISPCICWRETLSSVYFLLCFSEVSLLPWKYKICELRFCLCYSQSNLRALLGSRLASKYVGGWRSEEQRARPGFWRYPKACESYNICEILYITSDKCVHTYHEHIAYTTTFIHTRSLWTLSYTCPI